MVVVREPTIASKVVFFVARNHFINLVRKPGRIAIIQGCAPGGYIGDRDGVWRLKPARTEHAVPRDANRAARSVSGVSVHDTTHLVNP
jgi:hypothetical protein